jgi:hypothetical protein
MSKIIKKTEDKPEAPALPIQVSGKFFSTAKVNHLLYVAVEIEVYKGIVVGVKLLQKAGDLAASSVGHCSRGIWAALRNQEISGMLPEGEYDA